MTGISEWNKNKNASRIDVTFEKEGEKEFAHRHSDSSVSAFYELLYVSCLSIVSVCGCMNMCFQKKKKAVACQHTGTIVCG